MENVPIESTRIFDFITSNPSTMAASDADSLPSVAVYEDTTDVAILSPTPVKRTSLTGNYRVPVVCLGASGFEVGKSYNVIASATVNSIAGKAVIASFRLAPLENVAGYQTVDIAYANGTSVSGVVSGVLNANIVQINGSGTGSSGFLNTNVIQFGGTAGTFAAGVPAVNTVQLSGVAQTARNIGASVLLASGTGQGQISMTAGIVDTNVTQFGGSAGTFAGGRPAVNAVQLSGVALTARDIGANVLLASGTGQGQLSFTNGIVASTLSGAQTIPTLTITATGLTTNAVTLTGDTNKDALRLVGNGTGADLNLAGTHTIGGSGVDGYTIVQALEVIMAFAAAKATGADTSTVTFRSISDSRNCITMTVDASGNRSAVTLNVV